MLNIPPSKLKEFSGRFETHKLNVAASNMYVQMAALIGKNAVYLDRDTYMELFLDALSDIELVSSPTDAFIPSESGKNLFDVNRLAPEYIEITKRIPIALFEETLGPTSALTIMVKNNPAEMELIYDDLFRFFSLFKYLDVITMIRLNTFSNYTPIIEYMVENITLDQWKDFLKSNKPNETKYAKICEDLMFNPDVATVVNFYRNEASCKFDVLNLMMRLCTNAVLKTDPILILGVYLIISFAMKDFKNENIEPSECSKYVTNVLSIL